MASINCSNDEDDSTPYPALVTELADMPTDAEGTAHQFTTDEGKTFTLTTALHSLQPLATYRVMCGYVEQEGGLATLYQLKAVPLLQDTVTQLTHPTGVDAAWRGGDYINVQLTPKTQGGNQLWGYAVQSVRPSSQGGKAFTLMLTHDQQADPLSYTTTLHASIYLPQLEEISPGDSIYLSVNTFKGIKTWGLVY